MQTYGRVLALVRESKGSKNDRKSWSWITIISLFSWEGIFFIEEKKKKGSAFPSRRGLGVGFPSQRFV